MIDIIRELVLFITGMVAGTFGGMLGVGGGFLMNPVQFWLLDGVIGDPSIATRIAFATGLAVALPLSISGAAGHFRRGAVDLQAAMILGFSGMIAGFAGGSVAEILSADLLRPLFALILLSGAAGLYLRGTLSAMEGDARDVHPALLVAMGLCTGFLSGLFGVGGGFVLVPLLVLVCRYPMHRAVGTSTAFIVLAATGGILSYIVHAPPPGVIPFPHLGYIDLPAFLALAAGAVPMARIGVHIAHRLPREHLKALFTVMMILIALRVLGVLPV